ncbi:MAG: hypothetical protein ACRCZI_00480, partial [Cetobacterium sp.]
DSGRHMGHSWTTSNTMWVPTTRRIHREPFAAMDRCVLPVRSGTQPSTTKNIGSKTTSIVRHKMRSKILTEIQKEYNGTTTPTETVQTGEPDKDRSGADACPTARN